jgi:methionyl-tRNA formyltransferase
MKTFGFYVLGFKGYESLKAFFSEIGTEYVAFVVSARDKNIDEDCFELIRNLCSDHGVAFRDRSERSDETAGIKFAIGWRWIISDSEDLVVFHDSLLPKYRGFAPLVNSLINGENEVGVTALKAASEYDSGDIVGQKRISIEYPVKIFKVIEDVSILYAELLVEVSRKFISGDRLVCYEQNTSRATYSLWRDELDYKVSWYRNSKYISRFIDAVGYPYKGAEATVKGEKIHILDCEVVDDVEVEDRSAHVGKVIFMNAGLPTVICGEGLLQLNNFVDQSGHSLVGKISFRSRFGR